MKIVQLLKLKMALRIALPCLALSVLMPACSNDDVTEDVVVDNTVSSGLVFKASFPALEDDASTRLGINEDLIPLNPNITEPLIWIEGEKFSFNFVKGGVGQVVEYVITSVADKGRSCVMEPVAAPTLVNGEYTVYVVTPHSDFNFIEGSSTSCLINLSGQSQPASVDNYANLSNYLYAYAQTTIEVAGNDIVGSNSLSFDLATSLLRFNVTNATGDDATITNITISHTGTTPQFRTSGVFNPTTGTFSGSGSASSLSLPTAKTLSDGDAFDAYLSIIPTAGFENATEKISIRVDYTDADGETTHKDWEWSVNEFSSSDPYAAFNASGRFLFTLKLGDGLGGDPNDPMPFPNPNEITMGNYGVTWNQVNDQSKIQVNNQHGIFLYMNDVLSSCPIGYYNINTQILTNLEPFIRAIYNDTGSFPAFGVWPIAPDKDFLFEDDCIHAYFAPLSYAYLYPRYSTSTQGPYWNVGIANYYFRPLCYRELP